MRRLIHFVLFLALLGQSGAWAQNSETIWRESLERWAESNEQESIDDDLLEKLTLLRESPINLNDTLSSTLEELPFINPFQMAILKSYIRQYGQIYSWTELGLIRGFDSTTIMLLRPIATIQDVKSSPKVTLSDIMKHGHSNLVVGGKETLEKAQGYQDSSYPGSPLRLYFRYQYKYHDRIAFQLSGDKDPGEQFFQGAQRQGFDYYGYYLQLKGFDRFTNTIIGKYQLHFGQGLTLWSGSGYWDFDGMAAWRHGNGIQPSSALCEYGYLQGIATTINLGHHIEITSFYSNVKRDATQGDSANIVQSLYSSGYHRTENEQSKQKQLGEQLLGFHLHYHNLGFSTGLTAYQTILDKPLLSSNSLHNSLSQIGTRNTNIGTDIAYRHHNMICFGELALSYNEYHSFSTSEDYLPLSAIVGFQYQATGNTRINGYYRHFSPTYLNLHANPNGQGSSGNNEEGLCLNLQTILPFHIHTIISADVFRFPWMRYRIYSPSHGAEYKLRLQKSISAHAQATIQYRLRQGQRNIKEVTYQTVDCSKHQLYLLFEYLPSEEWKLATKVSYSWFQEADHGWNHGFLAYQDITYRPIDMHLPLSLSFRYLVFDIEDYDVRIYTFENDFLYEFSTPSFQGKGYRMYSMVKYDITKDISLGVRYGITQYLDREKIGSGHETINRSHKQEIKLQLRLKF